MPMCLQKGRLKMYLVPYAFHQGHFENSQEMNISIFFLNSLNHSASLQLLRREAVYFFQDTR